MNRINTAKLLHNSYLDGTNYQDNLNVNSPMQVNPMLTDQYDYAVTDDPELLQDRQNSFELAYEIFAKSEYNDGRFKVIDSKGFEFIKVPKEQIADVFNYMKEELLKLKAINPMELIIIINEFFEFNYDYVYKKVLTPQMKQALIEDIVSHKGLENRVKQSASIKLF